MPLPSRWRKVLGDLWVNKARTLLVIFSISIAVFGVGTVMTLYILLMDDMNADYLASNPHSALLYTSAFDEKLVQSVERVPGVASAEGRASYQVRLQAGPGQYYPLEINAVPDPAKIRVDLLRPEDPPVLPPLNEKELFIERTTLELIHLRPGDLVSLDLPNHQTRQVRVSAIVHDSSSFSYLFTGKLSAFASQDTLEWLGGPHDFNRVLFTVREDPTNEAHVNAVARQVADKVKKGGFNVFATVVFFPGEHPMSHFFRTGLLLIGFFGILLTFLSVFLVINTINALLSQHVRQIGVMKAVGGRTGQLVGMYLVMVACFGLLALAVATWPSALLAYRLTILFAGFFNFNLSPFHVPWLTITLQGVVALLVPLLAALFPVLSGVRLTIHEAITAYGITEAHYGYSFFDRLIDLLRGLPRPLLLSLRNTFRRKLRLGMTLLTLTLGGAIFISVFNLQASLGLAIQEASGYELSNINLTLDRVRRLGRILPLVNTVPGVVKVEGWARANAQVMSPDEKVSTQVVLWGAPLDSNMIQPVLTEGRWLRAGDENAIVIGNHFLEKRPDVKLGDDLLIKINDKETEWHVVGIYQLAQRVVPPNLYVSYDYFSGLMSELEQAASYRIQTDLQDQDSEEAIARQVEARFKQEKMNLLEVLTGAESTAREVSQFNILVYVLLVMAVLIAVVGGLGLAGMMGMNVLERTREIGVMRAIGASDRVIFQIVIVEGMLVGLISWVFGLLLSLPVSALLSSVVGIAFMSLPLTFVVSANGIFIWLAGVLLLSAAASFIPARRAYQLTIREVLAYE
jgi:putative ABC transport system permease protein